MSRGRGGSFCAIDSRPCMGMIHEFVRGGGRAVRVRVRVRVRVKKEEEEKKKGGEDAFFDWRTAAGARRSSVDAQ